jgi:hypothetical protein
MSPAVRTWLIITLTLSYLATAHVALMPHSRRWPRGDRLLALLFPVLHPGRQRAVCARSWPRSVPPSSCSSRVARRRCPADATGR